MNDFRWPWLVIVLASAAVGYGPEAAAEPFWKKLPLVRNRIEADPNKSYTLSDVQGPWLILATTFVGDKAHEQAHELALEFRKRFRLPAYTHRMNFDFTKQAKARGVDRYGDPAKVKYRTNSLVEVAVLVGEFEAVDDTDAQKALKMIKYDCEPLCMKAGGPVEDMGTVNGFRNLLKNARVGAGVKNVKRKMGPLANAHLTTNPLLPDEYYVPKGLDKFVVEMNEPVKYSLLNCKGRYTVKVATFSGNVIIDQQKIREVEKGKQVQSRLLEAADKAHTICEALRAQGHEAYEFHDRGQSIVTVGSFSSYGSPRSDGKIEINPQIHTLMTTFGADKQVTPGLATPRVGMPKTIKNIPLDIQPMIVEVPRKSISGDYNDTAMTRR